MNYGVKYFNFNTNVVAKVGLPPKTNTTIRAMFIYTQEEFQKFSNAIDDITYKAFYETLYWTGIRKAEVYALVWDNIDFDNNILSITKTLAYVQGKGGFTILSKNATSSRNFLLDKNRICILKELKSTQIIYFRFVR